MKRESIFKAGIRWGAAAMAGPIAKGTGVSLVIRLIGLVLLFAQAILAARLLGLSGYGTVAVVTSFVGIVAIVCQMGFGALAIREIAALLVAKDTKGIRHFFYSSTRLVAVLALLSALALAIMGWTGALVPEQYRLTLGLGAFLVVPIALTGLFRGVAQGFGRVALAQTPGDLVRPAILVFVMGAAARLGIGFSTSGYMILATVSSIAAAAVAWVWLRQSESRHLSTDSDLPKIKKNQIVVALPFLGLGLTTMLQGEINTLMLGLLVGPKEAGLFQPVARLAPLMILFMTAAGMRYAPRMAEFWQRGEIERIRSVTATFTLVSTFITLATALAICVSGPWLMWAFGPEFGESAYLLWYVAAAQVFSVGCGPLLMLMLMDGKGSHALTGQLAGLATNAAVGLLLIPSRGAEGAVIAMSIGIVTWSAIMLVMFQKRYGFNPSLFGRKASHSD